jgi:hypothetical protein
MTVQEQSELLEYRPPPGPDATLPAPAMPPPRPRSVLGRLTLAATLIVVGTMAMVDLSGARLPVSAYFAVPLAVVGAGLLVGAWYGRARGLIAFGAVLAVLLAIVGTSESWDLPNVGGNVTWRPASIEQLDAAYDLDIGNGVLDLSALDFTGRSQTVEARVDVGNLTVILPSTVDAQVTAKVDVGNATIFGRQWNGIGQSGQTIVDVGSDGPGGGEIAITASVDVGDVEVRR